MRSLNPAHFLSNLGYLHLLLIQATPLSALTALFLIQTWHFLSQDFAQAYSRLSSANPKGKNKTAGPGSKINNIPKKTKIAPTRVKNSFRLVFIMQSLLQV